MATQVTQRDSDLETAKTDIAAAADLAQLKIALRTLIRHDKRQEDRIDRLRGEIRILKRSVKALQRER